MERQNDANGAEVGRDLALRDSVTPHGNGRKCRFDYRGLEVRVPLAPPSVQGLTLPTLHAGQGSLVMAPPSFMVVGVQTVGR